MLALPTTSIGVYRWSFCLLIVYVMLAAGLDWVYRRWCGQPKANSLRPIDWFFNGATFAFSIILVIGLFDSDVLRAIGHTTPSVVVAAAGGVVYSVQALKLRR